MGEQQQHLACLFPQRLRNHISNDPCWRDLVKQCWCESPWERAAASSAKPQRRGRGQLPPLIQSKTSSLAERIRGGWWRWWGGTAGSLCYYPKSSTFRQKPLLLWTSQTVWQQTDLHHRFSRRRQVDRWGSTGPVTNIWVCSASVSHRSQMHPVFIFLEYLNPPGESAHADTNLQNINLYYFTLQMLFKAPHVRRREHTDVFIRNMCKQSLTHGITWDLLWCWRHFMFSSCFHYWFRLNVNNLM